MSYALASHSRHMQLRAAEYIEGGNMIVAKSPLPGVRERVALLALQPARIAIASAFICMGTGILSAAPVAAQSIDGSDISDSNTAEPASDRIIEFAADSINYDENSDIVEAEGTVILEREGQRLFADKIVWNRTTGEVAATGQVRMVNQNGDVVYGENIELQDTLKDGVVENILIVMSDGGRAVAERGTSKDGYVTLENAAYTACKVETADGCPKDPTWRIAADEVYYDSANETISYDNARIELFGVPVVPLPAFSHSIGGGAKSGLLAPKIGYSNSNGAELSVPYYWRLAPNIDFRLTGHAYSEVAPMLGARYRHRLSNGAFEVEGFGTYGRRTDISSANSGTERDWRGYLSASGELQLDPNWSTEASVRLSSDRTFADRYDINEDDRLRNTLAVQRIDGNSFFEMRGWYVQTLRAGDSQDKTPIALPMVDFRYRLPDKLAGGRLSLQANTLGIYREDGQDTQRAFASTQWDRRSTLPGGQELTFTLFGRGDIYHSDENSKTTEPLYSGDPGWQGRGIAVGAVDVKWPFVGQAFGGTQLLTPRIQVVASPKLKNLDIPNEDARAIDLETSNLFALNRFPGYDRYEDNVRITYGLDWRLVRNDFRLEANIGQSYRLSNRDSILPDGTGLSDRLSDAVGRVEVRWLDKLALAGRFRIDKDSGALRRIEADATFGDKKTYGKIGYLRLNRDISGLEDLQDSEELRLAGRLQFHRYWATYGSVIFDLTNADEVPLSTADGFETVRSRAGLIYEDECLGVSFLWDRKYERRGDSRAGDKFSFQLSFRNLGG